MLRAVLFDLGNTLVRYYRASEFPPVLRECLRCCCARLGIGTSHEEALFERALSLGAERADLTVWPLAERMRMLFEPYVELPDERLAEASSAFLEPIFASAVPDPLARPVLEQLRSAGLKTGIVSNTPWGSPAAPWREELARHGLLECVDAVVFCADVGMRKPHAAPFLRAMELLGVAPAETVFVGDDVRWDIAGAQAAGVRPMLLSKTHSATEAGCAVIADLGALLPALDPALSSRRTGIPSAD